MFELKDFQKEAVSEMSETFLKLWETGNRKIPLMFKAPTGAGKTIMMAEFLRCLDNNYQFLDDDKAYIWISFSEDSYEQSKKKLYDYFNRGTDKHLKDLGNLSDGKLYKNNIFFINWQKIKGTSKDSRVLRRETEHTEGDLGIFDEYIERTKEERDLVLIIDEAHIQVNTELANKIIDLIDPRIIIKVTATPKEEPSISAVNRGEIGYVEVLEKHVIESGLIKEKLIIQTEEEIQKIKTQGLDEDEMMLELAIKRRDELKGYYEELNLDINPLILIQLPSDEVETQEIGENKKDIVLSYLMGTKKIKEEEIAIWLSKEKKNLEGIADNDNTVNFMLFKVAPATGWDCPRADILVMFREIRNPVFRTQIIGRIKRMPEGEHYNKSELNKAYIYTNYNKSHLNDIEDTDSNKPRDNHAKLKEGIEQIKIQSTVHPRTDFNTLTSIPSWQKSCLETLHQYFGTNDDIFKGNENQEKISEKIDLTQNKVFNQIIVDAEIESFDNFISKLKEKCEETEFSLSQTDIERLYNNLCFRELKQQTVDEAKYNSARSWSPLKSALNVYFGERLNLERNNYYQIIINELLDSNSELKIAIHEALINFRQQCDLTIKEKESEDKIEIFIPENEKSFTDEYEEYEVSKNVYDIFYIKKEYARIKNETLFIEFLESQEIDWWHKQEDSGKSEFAIPYSNEEENKDKLFYPDWIIKKGNNIYILDTKAGYTLNIPDTKSKAEFLQKWISSNKDNYNFNIIGGIVKLEHPSWKINSKEEYNPSKSEDWTVLKNIIV